MSRPEDPHKDEQIGKITWAEWNVQLNSWAAGHNSALAIMRGPCKIVTVWKGGRSKEVKEIMLPDRNKDKRFQDGYCICAYLYGARLRAR